jgi:capsular exopolysaccharide synthesis family protein
LSKLYDALKRMEMEKRGPLEGVPETAVPDVEFLSEAFAESTDFASGSSATIAASLQSRLVALTEPRSLGAEKFRALVTRLEHLRQQKEFKSLQITSAVINEGKTLVAANLAITLAQHAGSKVLLVEGDLHRPTLSSLMALSQLRGLSHWWSGTEDSLTPYIHKLNEMPLWFLSAGVPSEQPSQILQSARFAEAFTKFAAWFDWIVVDSTPMSPIVDVNLWSRLVEGTLLVVREGVTPTKELKKGLAGLDNPKLLGVVLNEASEFDHLDYEGQYYAAQKDGSEDFESRSRRYFLHVEKVRTWLQTDMRRPGPGRKKRR